MNLTDKGVALKSMIGKSVWAAAYDKGDLLKKATRRMKPTEFLVEESTYGCNLRKVLASGKLSGSVTKHIWGNEYFETKEEAEKYYKDCVTRTAKRFLTLAKELLEEEGVSEPAEGLAGLNKDQVKSVYSTLDLAIDHGCFSEEDEDNVKSALKVIRESM